MKYAYTLSAAKYHTAYAKSQDYQSNVEIENIKYNFLIKHLKNHKYDYCEIGSDDGEISLSIIDFLNKNGILFHKHIFVDFSFELLNKCESRFSSFAPNLECEFIQHDIEKSNIMIPVSNERRKIILLLGNTLGNVESENSVLKNIYNSMNEDDLFLIGLTLWKENIDELEGYSNKIFRESVLEFLRIIGVQTSSENYMLRYDSLNHVVICEYEFNKPFFYQDIRFIEGEKIRCFQSRRYSSEYCNVLFKNNGFSILEKIIDNEVRHALFLLKKY